MNKDESQSVSLISAKIIKTSTRQEETFPFKKYIEYKVSLTSEIKTWNIKKRYKCFEQLHTELSKKVKHLPRFPEKKLFNMTESTISERRSLLEAYLNFIFNKLNFSQFPIILEFIEMEKEEFALLMKSPTQIEKPKKNKEGVFKHRKSKSFTLVKDDFFKELEQPQRNPFDIIENFLVDLEDKTEEKYSTIRDFWEFLQKQKQWPKFKREELLKLMFGNGSKLRGVLFHCGNIEENDLGAEQCLHFLANLLTFEYNPDCEVYISIVKMAKLEHINSINLKSHLQIKKNQKDCFTVINVLINDDKGITLQKLVEDENIEQQFLIWKQSIAENI